MHQKETAYLGIQVEQRYLEKMLLKYFYSLYIQEIQDKKFVVIEWGLYNYNNNLDILYYPNYYHNFPFTQISIT